MGLVGGLGVNHGPNQEVKSWPMLVQAYTLGGLADEPTMLVVLSALSESSSQSLGLTLNAGSSLAVDT